MTGASEVEQREFAAAFRSFLQWMHSDLNDPANRNEVVAVIQDFLGEDRRAHSVVSRPLPVFEHVNPQTAVSAWASQP